jgi:hypothetical protein
MKTIRFWTLSEVKAAKTCIEKFDTLEAAAEFLAPRINRTKHAVIQKMTKLKANKGTKRLFKSVVKTELDFPKKFSFELTPKRVVMTEDHIKIYF